MEPCATKNGKVICEGHNDGMRTKVLNNYRSCAHARTGCREDN